MVCKLVGAAAAASAAAALMSFVVDKGNICFLLCVGEGEGVIDRPNKFLIGSVAGNVSLICGDFSAAGNDDGSSIAYDDAVSKNKNNEKKKWKNEQRLNIYKVQRKWINRDFDPSNDSE